METTTTATTFNKDQHERRSRRSSGDTKNKICDWILLRSRVSCIVAFPVKGGGGLEVIVVVGSAPPFVGTVGGRELGSVHLVRQLSKVCAFRNTNAKWNSKRHCTLHALANRRNDRDDVWKRHTEDQLVVYLAQQADSREWLQDAVMHSNHGLEHDVGCTP